MSRSRGGEGGEQSSGLGEVFTVDVIAKVSGRDVVV